jgi:plasmid stabilization system protein ParE
LYFRCYLFNRRKQYWESSVFAALNYLLEEYENLKARLDLYEKLAEAEAEVNRGFEGHRLADVAKELMKDLDCDMTVIPFEIKLLTPARQDLYEIKQFIQQDRSLTARRAMERILQDIMTLEMLPEAGSVIDDERLRTMGYRYWPVLDGKYIAFCAVYKTKQLVQIRRILSARQDYLPILRGNLPQGSR